MKLHSYKYENHESVETPHGNTKIWRYLSLDKFLDLLVSSELYLSNISKLTDQYEATIPKTNKLKEKTRLASDGLKGRDLEEEMAAYRYGWESLRELSFVNCWSINRDESYALWKIYLGGSDSGVAIQTTVSDLKKAVRSKNNESPTEPLYIGKVRYGKSIHPEQMHRFTLICNKMPYYRYEDELRLFVVDFPPSEGGDGITSPRRIPVDIEKLVQNIYISPFSKGFFESVVKDIIGKYYPYLESRVRRSAIKDA